MNRPYTICHIFSALDGAIAGNFMYAPEVTEARKQYGKLRESFHCNAILYGTITMLDFCEGLIGNLPKSNFIDKTDYIASEKEDKYIIAIDTQGTLAYSKNYIERHNFRQHIIAVLTKQVSNEYLNYLRNLNISYIFAGENTLNCETIMIKLKELFGIERLLIAGGGYTNWSFADAGMIDELSLVLAPSADGEPKVTVFERNEDSINSTISFTLKEINSLDGNAIWLRYNLNNAQK